MSVLNIPVDFKVVFQNMPGMALLILPNSPDYTILEVSDQLLTQTKVQRMNVVGRNLFQAFPDNPAPTPYQKISHQLK